MKQYLDQLRKLSITARLSLFVAALLLVTAGLTVNNALSKQEVRTRAASSSPAIASSCSSKPALGNVQKSNDDPATQNNPSITYDLFADGRVDTLHRSSPVQTILEYYDHTSFKWSPDYINSRFQLARDNAGKTDYISFLMNEEIMQPSASSWYSGWQPYMAGKPGFSTGYGKQIFEGVEVDYAAGSDVFFLGLLKAWKQLCIDLNKKCALIGDGQSDPNTFLPWVYGGDAGVDYIAKNYDMVYAYSYPSSTAQASCQTSGFSCGKTKVDYWRSKGFTGKINYILTTEQFGAQSDAVVAADFKSAADAGGDIISAYPYKHTGDTLATARMIQIWNEYIPSPTICTTPSPTQNLTQTPVTPNITPTLTLYPSPTLPYATPTIYCGDSCVITPTINPCTAVAGGESAKSAKNQSSYKKKKGC